MNLLLIHIVYKLLCVCIFLGFVYKLLCCIFLGFGEVFYIYIFVCIFLGFGEGTANRRNKLDQL